MARVMGFLIVVLSVLWILYATLGRKTGRHQPMRWEGGGTMTLTGELSGALFLGSLGLVMLEHSPLWILPAIMAWLIGFLSQRRSNRKFHDEEDEMRARNAEHHPGIFDSPPPLELDAFPGDQFDLYDSGTCTFLGTIPRSDVAVLAKTFGTDADQLPNDLYVILESLELLGENSVTPETRALLESRLAERDYLLLRWMPKGKVKR